MLAGLWMSGIWWLSGQSDLSSGLEADFLLRKVAHMFEFGVLTYLLYRAYAPRTFSWIALLAAAVSALLYAGLDEWHQTWVAGREGKMRDIAVDFVGIAVVVILLRRRAR